jgi:hypothetical protein
MVRKAKMEHKENKVQLDCKACRVSQVYKEKMAQLALKAKKGSVVTLE